MRFSFLGHNTFGVGSHYDNYTWEYYEVTEGAPDASVFALPAECEGAKMLESDDAPAPVLAVDNRFVCFAYHRAMIAGMSLVAPLLNAAVPAGSAPHCVPSPP